MTTTDRDLTEQIARVLNTEGWTFEGVHEPGEYDECGECRSAVDPIAAAVLPIVKAAQAEALRDAVEKHGITIPDALGYKVPAVTVEDLLDTADQIEKEHTR